MAVRVLGADGTGLVSDVLAGIDWIITNRSLYKIRVLNISLGHAIDQSYAQDPLCQAVERAWKAGIVVVVSAGNMGELGYGTVVSPGNDPYVITVGASNNYWSKSRSDDILTTYTSRGPTALDRRSCLAAQGGITSERFISSPDRPALVDRHGSPLRGGRPGDGHREHLGHPQNRRRH